MGEVAPEAGVPRFDVAVVGAGPAGLAAALRVRFVKWHEALPLSVVVLDRGGPGGLLRLGGRRTLTGPLFFLSSDEILSRLLADVEKLALPLVRANVVRIAAEGSRFRLECDDGTMVSARSVVVATGSRPLGGEADLPRDRLLVTYKGFSFLGEIVRKAVAAAGELPVAVVTNERAEALRPAFAGGRFVFLLPADGGSAPRLPGRVIRYADLGWTGAEDGSCLARIVGEDGTEREERFGTVVLDYISFQARPQLPAFGTEGVLCGRGVPEVDAELRARVPGLFFAGDVTGRFASVTAALSDGVVAGFGAYMHAYRAMFGGEPPLYAYRSSEHPEEFLERELPRLLPTDRVRVLGPVPEGKELGRFHGWSIAEIGESLARPAGEVEALVLDAIRGKWGTIERE